MGGEASKSENAESEKKANESVLSDNQIRKQEDAEKTVERQGSENAEFEKKAKESVLSDNQIRKQEDAEKTVERQGRENAESDKWAKKSVLRDYQIRKQEDAEKRVERQGEFQWNIKVEYDWTKEVEENLRQEILKERRDSLGKKMNIKILVFGLTGHGKSTLLNGFRSAILGEGHVTHFYQTGSASTHGSYSVGFCAARYGKYLSIIDMGGIYESKAFKAEDIENILTGKVPFYAKLTEHLQVQGQMDIPKPGKNDVSCVIIVMKPGTELGPHVKRQFEVVDSLASKGRISRCLVLTHLDETDPAFNDPLNLPNFVQSGAVQEAVQEMTELTGIPPSATSFVRNYVRENETNMYSNIMLLRVLKNIIFDAKECIERKIAQKQLAESDSDSE